MSLESLGEEGGPVSLNLVAGGLDDLSELVTLKTRGQNHEELK